MIFLTSLYCHGTHFTFQTILYLSSDNWLKMRITAVHSLNSPLAAVQPRCLFFFFFFYFPFKTQEYFPNRRLWTGCNNTLALVYEVLRQEFVTQRWPSTGAAAAASLRTSFDCLRQCHLAVKLHPLVITPPSCATPVFNSKSGFVHKRAVPSFCAGGFIFCRCFCF